MAFETQVFRKDDRVAWSQRAAIYQHETVMNADALQALFSADLEDEGERLDFGS